MNFDNHDLDHLGEQAQPLVQGIPPQGLRDNDPLRQHIATTMLQVRTDLGGVRTTTNRPPSISKAACVRAANLPALV